MISYKRDVLERQIIAGVKMSRGFPICERVRKKIVEYFKAEGDLSVRYQRSVQKPASLMVWGCISPYSMGSLHVLEGTMNAERYIKVLKQHMLPSRWCLFQGKPFQCISAGQSKTTYCSYYNSLASQGSRLTFCTGCTGAPNFLS